MKSINLFLSENRLHKFFRFGIAFKGLDGVLETIGSIVLAVFGKASLTAVAAFLTSHELSEDPHDVVANYIMNTTHHISAGTTIFASVYLLVHGLIKIGLFIALWRNKLWAYVTAIWFLLVFLAYQMYRFSLTNSTGLLLLSVLDMVIILLVWHEYRYLQKYGNKIFERSR
jgi:uncharacterized membrane protein